MCILDLIKTLYEFHYNYIKKIMVIKLNCYLQRTDSLTYEIEAEDVYQNFWKDKEKFENSNYPEASPFFDKTNKKLK